MINPDKTFHEMEKASEELADAVYNYTLLDEDKKSFLATIELEKIGNQTEIERQGRADERYRNYIKGLADAKKAYERAKARYANLLALNENRRSVEATNRYLINRG